MGSASYSIQNIVSYNFDDWFGIIEPLLEKQLLYHSNLDTPFFDEFAPENYDAKVQYKQVAESSDPACFVAFDDVSEPIGFATVFVSSEAGETYDTAHIIDVFVEEEYRGQGIASKLMEKAVS